MAKKILKLDYKEEFDFLLAAIICSYKDYRLCFELNATAKLNLRRKPDHSIPTGKLGASHSFSFYGCTGKFGEEFFLFANKNQGNFLIPEKPAVDFFLLVRNYGVDFNFEQLLKKMRSVEIITNVTEIDPYKLKSSENFLFD